MNDELFIKIIINNENKKSLTPFSKKLLFFKPTQFALSSKHRELVSFHEDSWRECFELILNENKHSSLMLVDSDKNYLRINIGKRNTILSLRLDNKLADTFPTIISFFDELFITVKGIVGHACSSSDDFWQNNDDLLMYKSKGRSLEGLKIIQDPKFKFRQIVDIEQFPGHSHFKQEIWFGSSWTMWFGKEYFNYIPEDRIRTFKNCHLNTQLADDVVKIVLYPDYMEYHSIVNRARQQEFRDYTGLDQLATALSSGIKPENADPHVEINRIHDGQNLNVIYYYNEAGESVSKSQSSYGIVREMNKEGKLLSKKMIQTQSKKL